MLSGFCSDNYKPFERFRERVGSGAFRRLPHQNCNQLI